MRKILLTPDFPDHVLWDWSAGGGPVTPEELGLSTETCGMLWDWYKWWGELYMKDVWEEDNTTKIDWDLLDVRGIEVWKRVQRELSGRAEVVFYSHRFEEKFEKPADLEELFQSERIA